MDHHLSSATIIRVALPCYENRVMPRFGCSRSFIFADILESEDKVAEHTEHTWSPDKNPDLPNWLRLQNVEGVLCGGIHPRFQIALEAQGLWVIWGFRGEIIEVLNQWLSTTPVKRVSGETPGPLTCCRLQKPIAGNSPPKAICTRRKNR